MAISDDDIDWEIRWLHHRGQPVTVNAVRVRSGGSPARIKARIAAYYGGIERVPKRSPKTAAQRQREARKNRQRELEVLTREHNALIEALQWCMARIPGSKQAVITERWPVLKHVIKPI